MITFFIIIFINEFFCEKNYYEILGVKKSATDNELRSAYRALTLKYHPDKAPEGTDPDIFIQVTKAYKILSDKTKRQRYDRSLETGRPYSDDDNNKMDGHFRHPFASFFNDFAGFDFNSQSNEEEEDDGDSFMFHSSPFGFGREGNQRQQRCTRTVEQVGNRIIQRTVCS